MTNEIGLHLHDLDTPALWVDLPALEHNIQTLAAHFAAAGVSWRPHIKGVKVPAIAHQAVRAGAIGVTCAKLGEAEVMAYAGIRDLLIANQIVGPQKVARLVSLARQADVKVAVDHVQQAYPMSAAAQAAGVEIGVLIEINTGMNRAGTQPGQPTVELAQQLAALPGLRFDGLMAWEGHTLALPDMDSRSSAVQTAVERLTRTAEDCRQAGIPVRIVSGGGSGTYQLTPFVPGITEIQAGGAIFNDVTYQRWGVQTQPALFVRATVTSRPAPERVIFDVGFKSLPAWVSKPVPLGIDSVKDVGMSAEHGIVTLDAPNDTIQIGDRFDFMVGYTDTTLFLHDRLYGVRAGVVETVWDIQARGRLR